LFKNKTNQQCVTTDNVQACNFGWMFDKRNNLKICTVC